MENKPGSYSFFTEIVESGLKLKQLHRRHYKRGNIFQDANENTCVVITPGNPPKYGIQVTRYYYSEELNHIYQE